MDKSKRLYILLGVLILFMLISIEISLSGRFGKIAPENVLIQVKDSNGKPEENANCTADLSSKNVNFEDKSLNKLNSIYDFLDASTYYAPEEKGFYLLETELTRYKGEYEIRVVCYSPNFSGVSYTIINNTNNLCEIKENGKYLIC